MSDVAIQLLLDNREQMTVYKANLIINVKGEVEGLIRDLSIFKAFIKRSREKTRKYQDVRELVERIRDFTFEAEDTIDAFVVVASDHKAKHWIRKVFGAFDTDKLRQVVKNAETMRTKVKEIYDNPFFGYEAREGPFFGYEAREGGDPSGRRGPDDENESVVGFDDATTNLIDLLTRKTEDLQVISITGMGGVGKTTLANKVYNSPRVLHEFSTRSWIYVSQFFNKKELFLSILKDITQVTSEMSNMGDDELADEVCRNLTRKYLIVVDDVWGMEDWDSIKKAFPNIKNGSRILLTSRNKAVAMHANLYSSPLPYELEFLTDSESWKLLQLIVFDGEVPNENYDLMNVGMRIASECHGLPKAVVVIARMLQTNKCMERWETIANNVNTILDREDCIDVRALMYNHLPPYLKACFLYFGVFPEDYDIPVWILIRLWIAEGFVQKKWECVLGGDG